MYFYVEGVLRTVTHHCSFYNFQERVSTKHLNSYLDVLHDLRNVASMGSVESVEWRNVVCVRQNGKRDQNVHTLSTVYSILYLSI